MRKIFLIIDHKAHIRNHKSVLSRHQGYAAEIFSKSNDSASLALLSLGLNGRVEGEKKNHIWLFYFPFRAKEIYANYTKIKSKFLELGSVKLLISGDPWFGGLIVLVLKKMFFKDAVIEIQVHADIGDGAWRRISLINHLKYSIARLTLLMADQVRCVSTMQASKIFSRLPSIESKTVVIPIASSLESEGVNLNLEVDRPLSIGFVGRIHADRGINKFIEVVEAINSERQDFTVVIAGSGPNSEEFLTALRTIVGIHRISNYHEVDPRQMRQIWTQIGVLLSCPQAESFGRTLREAISFGVPIWISPTSGGLEFAETLKNEYFELLDPKISVEKVVQQFLSLSKIKIDNESAKKVIEENELFTGQLVQSWLKLAEVESSEGTR